MDFVPFVLPVQTHSANAAASSGAHFWDKHSIRVVASEAQARSASFAAEEEVEVEEEVAVEEEVEVDSPWPPLIPLNALEFAAMHAAYARRCASHLPSAAPRSSAVMLEREEKGHMLRV